MSDEARQRQAERFSRAVQRLELAGVVAIRNGSEEALERALDHLGDVEDALAGVEKGAS